MLDIRGWQNTGPTTAVRRHADGIRETARQVTAQEVEICGYQPRKRHPFTRYHMDLAVVQAAFAAPYSAYALTEQVVDQWKERLVV